MSYKPFAKPRIVVSQCLTFAKCRYDGTMIGDPFIDQMKPLVTFIPVCPEMEVGLGVPRQPIRLTRDGDGIEVFQPATGNKHTGKFLRFSRKYLSSLEPVDGFILKSRSPSCGINNTRIYQGYVPGKAPTKGPGIFGAEVLRRFEGLAIEDEGRLKNFNLREEFLIQLFLIAGFRETAAQNSVRSLTDFHAANKYLFMAYSQEKLRILGRIAANHKQLPLPKVLKDYERALFQLLAGSTKQPRWINAIMHIFGYFSESLSKKETRHFLNLVEEYRDERIPLTVVTEQLHSWAFRFENDYIQDQTLFNPYPLALRHVLDSGKGRL